MLMNVKCSGATLLVAIVLSIASGACAAKNTAKHQDQAVSAAIVQTPPIPQPLLVTVQSMPERPEPEPTLRRTLLDPATWLAIATFVLVVYTAKLARETRHIADDARETEVQTKRAYVQVSPGEFTTPITNISTSGVERVLHFDLSNTGQTPARNVEFWYRFVSYQSNTIEVPVSQSLFYPQTNRTAPKRFFPEIGTGKSVVAKITIADQAELNQIKAAAAASAATGGNTFYIEGIVIYWDIFGKKERKTWFKRKFAANKHGFEPTVDHNRSE